MAKRKEQPKKLGDAIEQSICDAYAFAQDRITSDAEAKETRAEYDDAHAELRALKDAALIVRALADPGHRYAIMFSPGRWSVIDRKPNDCRTESAGRSFVNGIPVLTDKARKALGET